MPIPIPGKWTDELCPPFLGLVFLGAGPTQKWNEIGDPLPGKLIISYRDGGTTNIFDQKEFIYTDIYFLQSYLPLYLYLHKSITRYTVIVVNRPDKPPKLSRLGSPNEPCTTAANKPHEPNSFDQSSLSFRISFHYKNKLMTTEPKDKNPNNMQVDKTKEEAAFTTEFRQLLITDWETRFPAQFKEDFPLIKDDEVKLQGTLLQKIDETEVYYIWLPAANSLTEVTMAIQRAWKESKQLKGITFSLFEAGKRSIPVYAPNLAEDSCSDSEDENPAECFLEAKALLLRTVKNDPVKKAVVSMKFTTGKQEHQNVLKAIPMNSELKIYGFFVDVDYNSLYPISSTGLHFLKKLTKCDQLWFYEFYKGEYSKVGRVRIEFIFHSEKLHHRALHTITQDKNIKRSIKLGKKAATTAKPFMLTVNENGTFSRSYPNKIV